MKARNDKWIQVLAYGAIALASCGGDLEGDPEDFSQAALTQSSVDFNLVCDQAVTFVPVDPTIAGTYLPDEFDLYLEDGAAQIMIVLQNCDHAEWDGEELAPLQMAHIWIRRDGPFEVVPIPGTDLTVPTFYWYQHAGRTTSNDLFVKMKQAGMKIAMADSITLAPPGGPVRFASVVNNDLPQGPVGFDWVRPNLIPFSGTWGINHRIVGYQDWTPEEPDATGKVLTIYDRGYIELTGRQSLTMITPHAKSDLAKFGSVLYGVSTEFELHFTATLTTSDDSE